MERVHFQQEQMLEELKDLVEKNLFTLKETRDIVKKRTAFESALVRRVAKKADFLRYATYEMGLEQLRRKRVERLQIPRSPTTISDYALVRRQFHIFERALKRFKGDVGLWLQYIQVAKREGARTLVGRITARALQLHPNTPALYILAASHELSHLSPSSARALLQRGLRLNADSVDMWREYVRMELGFIESLRRRWGVLGINEKSDSDDAAVKDKALSSNLNGQDDVIPIENDDEPALDQGDEARREIMQGAIVKSVISNAAQALPKIELFESLNEVLTQYPVPSDLRESLIQHLDAVLQDTLPDNPRAVKLLCTRCLRPEMKGDELVEGIKRVNETLLRAADSKNEQVLAVYADFVQEWSRALIDENLKLYLIASLERLAKREKASPSLLSAHIRLLDHRADGTALLTKARKYTSQVARAAGLWLVRLETEAQYGSQESVVQAWAEARRSVSGPNADVLSVWLWGLPSDTRTTEENVAIHKTLLKESMRTGLLFVHEELLITYVKMLYRERSRPKGGHSSDQATKRSEWDRVRHMDESYLTTGNVWREVFKLEEQVGDEATMRQVYERWRRKEVNAASLEWAKWLLRNGKGKEASSVVQGAGLGADWDAIIAAESG